MRHALATVALAAAVVAAHPGVGSGQDDPTTTTTAPPRPAPPPAVDPVVEALQAAAYGPPRWLPLRRDLAGGPITVGCTYDSHGSPFGYECGGHHDRWAIDFLASAGTPVFAAGRGWATNLTGRPGGGGFGNVVQVDHGRGDTTLYAHLTTVLVPAGGAWVDQDTQLGTVGSTGSSSANHLHYERRNIDLDVSVDPGPLLTCRAGLAVRYPDAGGSTTWKGLAWGAITVIGEDTTCADDDGLQRPLPGEKTTYGATSTATAAEIGGRMGVAGLGPWALLPAQDPLDAAFERLLTPTG